MKREIEKKKIWRQWAKNSKVIDARVNLQLCSDYNFGTCAEKEERQNICEKKTIEYEIDRLNIEINQ